MTRNPVLSLDSINQNVLHAHYAVRGECPTLADELAQRLQEDPKHAAEELGFDEIVYANIGNPQQLEQKPITYIRQIAALTEYPDLLQLAPDAFPEDVKQRAQEILEDVKSVGAYTHSKGVLSIRKHVAEFLEERDGHPADPESIYLTAGASAGVQSIFNLLMKDDKSAVMIPIPQYPLYSASVSLFGGHAVPYYLNEEQDWATNMSDIRHALHEARQKGHCDVRAIVLINPSNPTGSVLLAEQIKEVLHFAYEQRLLVLADEVYQTNIYQPDERPFFSFKKALSEMPQHIAKAVELVSFHSISKGFIGECGRRGGFFELVNIDPDVEAQLYKLMSSQLCSPVSGQIAVDLMVRPPPPGAPSHKRYFEELNAIEASLHERAQLLRQAFTHMEGYTCSHSQGALYLFPRLQLPQKAIDAAKEAGKGPDLFYCLQLLKSTGICVVPGSGFGQKEGTLHFRTTFLPPQIKQYAERIASFHQEFMDKYR